MEFRTSNHQDLNPILSEDELDYSPDLPQVNSPNLSDAPNHQDLNPILSEDELDCSADLPQVNSPNLSDAPDLNSPVASNDNIFSISDSDILGSDSDTNIGPGPSSTVKKNCCSDDLTKILGKWALSEKNVSKKALFRLLKSLNEKFIVPKSSEKLLKQAIDLKTRPTYKDIHHGKYCHLPWLDCLHEKLQDFNHPQNQNLNLTINIDGISVFNNSVGQETYPILVSTLQYPDILLTVGVYSSLKEDKSLPESSVLLKDFIDDINSSQYNIIPGPFIVDQPIRRELKCIMNHNAYYGCDRCLTKGQLHSGRVIMPELDAPPRLDDDFESDDVPYARHRKGVSYLKSIGYPTVSGFLLDTLHLVHLGVTKRFLYYLRYKVSTVNNVHFLPSTIKILDQRLDIIRKFLPSEFNRRLHGGFLHFKQWKGSEFRTFLLYIGIVIFEDEQFVSGQIFSIFFKTIVCYSHDV